MSIEKITQISTLAAAILTACAIIIAGAICLARLIQKAKRADSLGGTKITPEEWKEIIFALLPFGVKILEAVSNVEKKEPEEKIQKEEKKEVEQKE